MRAPERLRLIHVVALAPAIDAAVWPEGAVVLRTAPDEALALAASMPQVAGDPHAIVRFDEGYAAIWLSSEEARERLARTCEWELPSQRPAFAQGAVAGLPPFST